MLQIPELLAPAGDLERLRYAINYGADAVYCGLPEFGMRSAPANFTPEQLAEGVIYAHARGRKVYLTMNTLPTNEEADRLPEAIKEAAKAGVYIHGLCGDITARELSARGMTVADMTELLGANPMPEIFRVRKDGSAVESAEQQNKRERTWDLNEGYTAEKTE